MMKLGIHRVVYVAVWLQSLAVGLKAATVEGGEGYRFQPGERLAYDFTLELGLKDRTETYSGVVEAQVGASDAERMELQFSLGGWEYASKPRFGVSRGSRSASGSGRVAVQSQVVSIDLQGEMVDQAGAGSFPAGMGPLAIWIIKPLPPDGLVGSASWERRMTLDWVIPEGVSVEGLAAQWAGQAMQGELQADYSILGRTDRTVSIGEELDVAISAPAGETATLRITGSGVWIFNLRAGRPEFFKGDYRLIPAGDTNGAGGYPADFRITFQEEGNPAVPGTEPSAGNIARVSGHEIGSGPHDVDERARILSGLSSSVPAEVHSALELLDTTSPSGADDEVALGLAFLLSDPDRFTRLAAAKALGAWGTSDSVPVLLDALQDDFFLVEMEVMRALGRLGDERAVAPILDRLESEEKRPVASAALKELAGIAEPALIERLDSLDWSLRLEIVRILTKIGSEDALPKLDSLALDDRNGLVRQAATEAVTAIRER
ncbi:MAG: HEAT repeat domain-containing protein [Verrucomicrobiota bacterium]|nr:HEAT repeat domain-containing protein [Verrucomicrobiota bacterium]